MTISKMKDSQSHQNFQIQDPYSIFHVPPQKEEETINWKDRTKALVQCQNDFIQSTFNYNQSIDRVESTISHFVNTINDRNEESPPNTLLTILGFL